MNLTTLAIIGGGICGRSLLYTLAKEQKAFEKITLFHSDIFFRPCSLNSTAIVAPRGVTAGHSNLGNLLAEGYQSFSAHVHLDAPEGVEKVIQYTAASEKLDAFKLRYPNGNLRQDFFKQETYTATEDAFLISPKLYLNWLLQESIAMEQYHLDVIQDAVTEISESERVHVKTVNGRSMAFDKVIVTGGVYNRFWNSVEAKSVQGSYLEFNNVRWEEDSFSLTRNGQNLIYNNKNHSLLIGSSSEEINHELAPDLSNIYESLKNSVTFDLPPFFTGEVKVGLREKAKKREPYIMKNHNIFYMGGFYKNGFTLGIKMAKSFSHQNL